MFRVTPPEEADGAPCALASVAAKPVIAHNAQEAKPVNPRRVSIATSLFGRVMSARDQVLRPPGWAGKAIRHCVLRTGARNEAGRCVPNLSRAEAGYRAPPTVGPCRFSGTARRACYPVNDSQDEPNNSCYGCRVFPPVLRAGMKRNDPHPGHLRPRRVHDAVAGARERWIGSCADGGR